MPPRARSGDPGSAVRQLSETQDAADALLEELLERLRGILVPRREVSTPLTGCVT